MSFRKPFDEGSITILPARPGQWEDLEQLFGERGAYAGYWCMFWRLLTGFSGYTGLASAFRALGFQEVGRASESQLIMRYTIEGEDRSNLL